MTARRPLRTAAVATAFLALAIAASAATNSDIDRSFAVSDGGRLVIDLTTRTDIAQINSYSWHPNTRGPKVYTLYASDGSDSKFNAAPKAGVDPTTVGWVRVASVDTRPKGDDPGGQYGVSIAGRSGGLGQYRYLLFECSATEMQDDYGNTFYSEIDVIATAASRARTFDPTGRRFELPAYAAASAELTAAATVDPNEGE